MHRHPAPVLLAVCCALVVPDLSTAARWDVHADGTGDAPTIQAAVDLAAPGDSVVLSPGTFRGPGNRDVSFNGLGLVVTSSAGRDVTIVDCEGMGRAFVFGMGEPRSAQLLDITIMNGSADQGGGIFISNASHPLIRGCVVTQCSATRGGGIYCGQFSAALIEHNLIIDNTATNGGGFSDDSYCSATVRFNTIRNNSAVGSGGGIYSHDDQYATVFEGNLIEGNSAGQGGGVAALGHFFSLVRNRIMENSGSIGAGVYVAQGGSTLDGNLIARNHGVGVYLGTAASLLNCTIAANLSHGVYAGNTPAELTRCIIAFNGGNAVACSGSPGATLDCCDVFGNALNPPCAQSFVDHLASDPRFCMVPGENEFCLRPNSPCAPATSPCGELIGAFPVCECPTPAFVECPPDTTVPLGAGATFVTMGVFAITNEATIPMTFNYQLTSGGPATLWDQGNPLALSGETPLLQPGESHRPPQAVLYVLGNPGMFAAGVECLVQDGTGVDKTCATVVTFEQPLPVAFAGFEARLAGRTVHLSWVASHEGADEIVVRRRVVGDPGVAGVIKRLPVGTIEYTDGAAAPGRVNEYDLVMMGGGEALAVAIPVRVLVPALSLAFQSVAPNPFYRSTRIVFEVPAQGVAIVEVFDIRGRRVRTLHSGLLPPGTHQVDWALDGAELASGVYIVRLSQGNASVRAKVSLIK